LVRASIVRPGQVSHADRAPRNEADAQLLADRENAVPLRISLDQRVFGLNRRDRVNGMRPADRVRARLGESKVPDLALLDEIPDRARHVFDRHGGVDPVLVVEIDAVGTEALERALDGRLDVLRSAVQAPGFQVEAELGRDSDLVADRRERLSDQVLVGVGRPYTSAVSKNVTPFSWAVRMTLTPWFRSAGGP
jgi:hypothetical protein